MSGYICGKVVFDNQELSHFDEVFDTDVINQYKLDSFEHSSVERAQFACGLIYVTEEDQSEKLPFHDIEAGLYITADVILDNRDELIQELTLNNSETVITDGFIVLEAYKKWGYDTPKHLLGDFAFAIWDEKKQVLFITRDHTGTRSLYYTKDENSIRFSTTLNPLIGIVEDKQALLCEEWLISHLILPNGVDDYDSCLTLYNNINQCPLAHSLVISQSETNTNKFWEPLKLIDKKNTEFSRSKELASFKSIFNEAVKCRTRSSGEIGVSLSSGLDSTSVAAVAATELMKNDKTLHSFTSIPFYQVEGYNEEYEIINEKDMVEIFVNHFKNIQPNYLDCPNQDIIMLADKLIEIIETPFKSIGNLTWINESYKKASTLGCRILLTGQFGNASISRGRFLTHIKTLKKHCCYFEILSEVDAFAKIYNLRKRVVLKKIIIMMIPDTLKKIRRISRIKKPSSDHFLEDLNEDLLNEYRLIKKMNNKRVKNLSTKRTDFYEEGLELFNEGFLSSIGASDSKFGLHYGLITRDPTKDVRVVEFCLRAPFQLFVSQGIERKLIRDSMENIVPDEIRLNYSKFGRQGVDWAMRIYHNRKDFFDNLESLNNNQTLVRYIKHQRIQEILKHRNELFETPYLEDLKQVVNWIVFSKSISRLMKV